MLLQNDQGHMLALRCDLQGKIIEILFDKKNFFGGTVQESMVLPLNTVSKKKFQAMLSEAHFQGASLRPDIRLVFKDSENSYAMFTLRIEDEFVVMAVQKPQHMFMVYEEFMGLINEQGQMLRQVQKEVAERALSNREASQLDGYMRINNEFANMQRELGKKNKELSEAYRKIEMLSRTDPLSGLANRRYLSERLDQALALSSRNSMPLSLMMADLDHFKSVNDGYGHAVGDAVIQAFARVLKEGSRIEDLAVRFGGEEFIVFMPGISAEKVFAAAERIRQTMSQLDLLGDGKLVTVSIGVAQFIQGDTPEKFIAHADKALYLAKCGGRNRVEMYLGLA